MYLNGKMWVLSVKAACNGSCSTQDQVLMSFTFQECSEPLNCAELLTVLRAHTWKVQAWVDAKVWFTLANCFISELRNFFTEKFVYDVRALLKLN